MTDQTLILFQRFKAETGDTSSAAMLVLAHALLGHDAKPLSVAEAAERRGVCVDVIYDKCREGTLRHRRTGRKITIDPIDLDAI